MVRDGIQARRMLKFMIRHQNVSCVCVSSCEIPFRTMLDVFTGHMSINCYSPNRKELLFALCSCRTRHPSTWAIYIRTRSVDRANGWWWRWFAYEEPTLDKCNSIECCETLDFHPFTHLWSHTHDDDSDSTACNRVNWVCKRVCVCARSRTPALHVCQLPMSIRFYCIVICDLRWCNAISIIMVVDILLIRIYADCQANVNPNWGSIFAFGDWWLAHTHRFSNWKWCVLVPIEI